jgi:hypothetical protein
MLFRNFHRVAAIALAGVFAAGLSASAMAETPWQQNHPRRAEVNDRLGNQDRRIDRGVADGRIGPYEAARLHRDDREIRSEERLMARQDGGHITRLDQRALNQQENRVSHQIGW